MFLREIKVYYLLQDIRKYSYKQIIIYIYVRDSSYFTLIRRTFS